MSTPIINAQMDAINGSMATLKGDLTTLRPLIKTLKETALNAYATESLSNQAIASFTDGAKNVPVKSLSVAITPIQNLNGQSSPYPAGGGKNKIGFNDVSETANGTNKKCTISNGLFTIAATGAVSSAVVVISDVIQNNGLGLTLPAGTYTYSVSDFSSSLSSITISSIRLYLYKNGSQSRIVAPNESFTLTEAETVDHIQASSAIQWSNGTTVKFRLQIESGSAPTAYAPYSNICPISGHTEVNVVRTGKNLANPAEWVRKAYSSDAESTIRGRLFVGAFPVGTQLSISVDANFLTTYKYAVHNMIQPYPLSSSSQMIDSGWKTSNSYQLTTVNKYIGLCVARIDGGEVNLADLKAQKIMLNIGTPTAYVPFAGFDTYTIDLDGTRYGGTLNVTTGVLTIDRAMEDLGTLTWYLGSNSGYGQFFYAAISGKATGTTNVLSDRYKTEARGDWTAATDHAIAGNSGSSQIYIKDSRYSSASTFKTAMNGIYVCYELATPTTVQLTPTEVATLLRQNNIWADTGDITEVTIRCDTALYLQKLVG